MTDNFNYSLVQNEQGTYSIRSTVKSFNLDHVTDKDVTSFYQSFSQFASTDTGLLPLDGTGVLAIRSAGPHTQIVTQHAPGMYHINWGAHEGDTHARTYYVAQPYRIVIGDFENGNLLGARMFYSPYPITSPNNVLYHVNLPNINCKGYRGNGVGWICLYHKDDWSALPFNEKVSRFIERCSGVETYNDANMNETDGPRFYQSKGKPSYLSDPAEWELKSDEEGHAWTLDPNLWISVKVEDMDNQGQHNDNGQELTLAMAMLGNYQAYYTDKNIPKMYNIISRPDYELTSEHVADFFKKSFAYAPVSYTHNSKDNPYDFTIDSRIKNGQEKLDISALFNNNGEDEDEDNNVFICASCEDECSGDITETIDGDVCENCLEEYFVYIESKDMYYSRDDSNIVYSNTMDLHLHTQHDTVFTCGCGESYGFKFSTDHTKKEIKKYQHIDDKGKTICSDCLTEIASDNALEIHSCSICSKNVITESQWSNYNPTVQTVGLDFENLGIDYKLEFKALCHTCAPFFYVCPCGFLRDSNTETANCESTPVLDDNGQAVYSVNQCCQQCVGEPYLDSDGSFAAKYTPPDETPVAVVIKNKIYNNINGITVNNDEEQSPF
jgi:hypothetical protein